MAHDDAPPAGTLTRRTLLVAGLAVTGAGLLACSPAAAPTTTPSSDPAPTTGPDPAVALADVETRFGGRLGLHALDTGTGATVAHRADERFLTCSVAKVVISALVLLRSVDDPGLLDRVVRYTEADLLDYAPVTRANLATGMTVSALCEAALTVSDNTAANLLSATVGGPPALTALVRGLGDTTSRFDRPEPDLNVSAGPDDTRDTSTPAALTRTLAALTGTGTASPLGEAQRAQLLAWMRANTTGAAQIRAGVPAAWVVAEKTGSGAQGDSNDAGVLTPPSGAPIVLTVMTRPDDPASTAGKQAIADATRVVVAALRP